MSDRVFPCVEDRLQIHESVYRAPQSVILGDVTIGADSSIWPMVVIRGDRAPITIGQRTNVQDGSILHVDADAALVIGDDVSIGHAAIVHGCIVENQVLIGMGAVVLSRARIGSGSLIAARALITEGMIVPPGSLVIGIPGVIKPLRPELTARILRTAASYAELKEGYRQRQKTA